MCSSDLFFHSFHFHSYTVSIHVLFLFFFFLFLVFLLHTSVQSLSPLLLFSFSSQENSSNLTIYFTSERERDCCSSVAPSPVEIEVAKRTKLVEISVHHAALPCSLPHCRSSLSPSPGWVRSTCSLFFFLFACSDSTLF